MVNYVSCRYERFGHTMNSIPFPEASRNNSYDIDVEEVMILTGGFSPDPSNDVWITSDGITWV